MNILSFFIKKPINFLLWAIPLFILAEILHWGELWIFIFSALSMVPLAGFIGDSTEVLAVYSGPRIGGLLNATLGNAAELIITIVAIKAGLLELVKASITGSILGNVLLVMGMAMLLGGFRNGVQRFDRYHASRNAILLVLAVIALIIPSVLSSSIGPDTSPKVEALSLGVAFIMIVLYALGIFYSFRMQDGPLSARTRNQSAKNHKEDVLLEGHVNIDQEPQSHTPHWSLRTSLIVLAISTFGVVIVSEVLVGTIEPVVSSLGLSEFFLGVILIPIIGNVAEHMVAVKVAIDNKMDLSVEIATASSLQIALFVAPVLVFVSLLIGNPLQLIFNQFELLGLIVGIVISAMVSFDGESNWLEGVELLAVYLILGLAFLLLPV
jgi:Ca2+:H+ antiporter